MTKETIIQRLKKGEKLINIVPSCIGQLCTIYKADKFSPGNNVIYIPDFDLNEMVWDDMTREEERLKDAMYTGDDFLEICHGNIELARELFDYCDWQHPTSALEADFDMCVEVIA